MSRARGAQAGFKTRIAMLFLYEQEFDAVEIILLPVS
jgi:hypothetical protein